MTETEFLALAEATLEAIDAALDKASANNSQLDVESSRTGNVLEIECLNNASKIIVNSQVSMQQLWVAARSGGFHYQYDGQKWVDTRDGTELFAALSKLLSMQAAATVAFEAPELA